MEGVRANVLGLGVVETSDQVAVRKTGTTRLLGRDMCPCRHRRCCESPTSRKETQNITKKAFSGRRISNGDEAQACTHVAHGTIH